MSQSRFNSSTGVRPTTRRAGFSLIEVTAVIALMAILAGVVTVSIRPIMARGKRDAARVELATLRDAIEMFNNGEGRYPSNDEGIAALTRPTAAGGEPLIRQMPLDPWGRPYQYNAPGRREPYEVICLGADGREGGTGADADLASDDVREPNAR